VSKRGLFYRFKYDAENVEYSGCARRNNYCIFVSNVYGYMVSDCEIKWKYWTCIILSANWNWLI